MGYREDYFSANSGIKLPGRRGSFYKCAKCGLLFNKSNIDIDHIIPKRIGGTDDLWNLQALCQHCNRSKGDNVSGIDIATSVTGAALSEGLCGIAGVAKGVVEQKVKDAIGIKYKR